MKLIVIQDLVSLTMARCNRMIKAAVNFKKPKKTNLKKFLWETKIIGIKDLRDKNWLTKIIRSKR